MKPSHIKPTIDLNANTAGLVLLKILALGQQQIDAKQTASLKDAIKSVRLARNKE